MIVRLLVVFVFPRMRPWCAVPKCDRCIKPSQSDELLYCHLSYLMHPQKSYDAINVSICKKPENFQKYKCS